MNMKNNVKTVTSPKTMVELSEFFLKMSKFQAKFDHPKLAVDCFTTSKTLLYWAKVGLEKKNLDNHSTIKIPKRERVIKIKKRKVKKTGKK